MVTKISSENFSLTNLDPKTESMSGVSRSSFISSSINIPIKSQEDTEEYCLSFCCNHLWQWFSHLCLSIWYYFKSWCVADEPYQMPNLKLDLLFSDDEINKMRESFWALKDSKWKEVIDGEYHKHGKYVFDQALHGRTKERGFIKSIEENAFPLLDKLLGSRTTSEMVLKMHEAACWHFMGSYNGTLMGRDRIGCFRDSDSQLYCSYASKHCTEQDWQGFLTEKIGKVSYTSDSKKTFRVDYKVMSQKQIEEKLNKHLDNFYQEIAAAKTEDEKIWAIARLGQHMDWLHTTRDGSTRTSLLIVQKHLTEFIGHPGIFEDPNLLTPYPLPKLVEEIKLSLKKWEEEKAKIT